MATTTQPTTGTNATPTLETAAAHRLAISCLLIAMSEMNGADCDLDKAYEYAEKAMERIGNLRILQAFPRIGGAA